MMSLHTQIRWVLDNIHIFQGFLFFEVEIVCKDGYHVYSFDGMFFANILLEIKVPNYMKFSRN